MKLPMTWMPAGLSRIELIVAMGLKFLLGAAYGYIFFLYYPGDDTWVLHRVSLEQTQVLLNDPGEFFSRDFTPARAIAVGGSLMGTVRIYLAHLENVIMIKIPAALNLLTGGNYYLNMLCFNVVVFFGHYWLFMALSSNFPTQRRLYYIIIFLFLPTVFWLSGTRAEGMLLFFFGLTLRGLGKRGAAKFSGSSFAMIIAGLIGLLILRNEFALLLVVAMAGYFVAVSMRKRPLAGFLVVYAAAILIFFTSSLVLPGGGFPGAVAARQNEFFQLSGTAFELDTLTASPGSFLAATPGALVNTLLRPYPWEAQGMPQLLASAETALFLIVFISCWLMRDGDWSSRLRHPLVLMLIVFASSMYLLIGYVVPFPGAIVRYRAVPELLLLCAAATAAGQNKLNKFF